MTSSNLPSQLQGEGDSREIEDDTESSKVLNRREEKAIGV